MGVFTFMHFESLGGIGTIALFFCVLLVALIAIQINKRRKLEKLVSERTKEFEAVVQSEREAQRLNQLLLDSAPFVMSLWDKNLRCSHINQQAVEMFGLSHKEEFITNFDELVPEYQPCGTSTKEKMIKLFDEARKNGRIWFEWLYLTKAGEPLPTEITLVYFNQHGEDMVVTYVNDLREVKAAMQNEREANEMNEIILNSTPLVMSIWDDSYNMVSTNQQSMRMFGLSNKEEFVKHFYDLSPKYQPCGTLTEKRAVQFLDEAFDNGFAWSEWMHVTTGGEELPAEITLVRFNRQGKNMVIAYTNDLRPVKTAMAKAWAAEEKAALLMETLPIACYMLDSSGKAIWCNQTALEMFVKGENGSFGQIENFETEVCQFECTSCDKLGLDTCVARQYLVKYSYHTFLGYKGNEEQIRQTINNVCNIALANGNHHFEIDHITFHGEIIPCESIIIPVSYHRNDVFACYIRDLREEKRREAAEEENRAKTRFLARMSHELRTPMNSVLGITELQLQKNGHSPETEEALLRIYSSSKLLLTIINDILDLSKAEAGKMEIVPAIYEVASLVVDTVQLNLMHKGSKRIEFKLNIDENLPAYLIGDEMRIKQILNNLLSNAFKYTDDGSVALTIKASHHPIKNDEISLSFCIKDTGHGMNKEQVDKLFTTEFTRFNFQNNRAVEGSGLGMTIIYHLIEMMEGKVAVESTPGKGSTITVVIPQKREGNNVLDKESIDSLQNLQFSQKYLKRVVGFTKEPMPYGRVLVVDDVESNLYVAKEMLFPYRINVETAESGFAAIKKIESGKVYDIIFMDHMMPEMDGIEATKKIRKLGYDQPIVALTANAVKGTAELFANNGFSGFVSKPIDFRQFNAYLVRYIRDKQPKEVLVEAQEQFGDSTELPRVISEQLAESFLRDAQESAHIMESIVNQQDWCNIERFIIQAHAIKSALSNIGESKLSQEAYVLEHAGGDMDYKSIQNNMPQFLASLQEVITRITPKEKPDYADEDLDYLREQLLIISEACENYNYEIANNSLKTLRNQNSLSKQTAKLLSDIDTYLLHSDFEEATELIQTVLKSRGLL